MKSTPKKYRLFIAGYGAIGRLHASVFAQRDDISGIVLADPKLNEMDAQQFIIKLDKSGKDILLHDDYHSLEPSPEDIVVIALPNQLHKEAADFFSAKGAPLLIEKPLGETYEQSKRIAETVTGRGTKVMCGLTGLYHPEFTAMYEALPQIGEVFSVKERIHEANPDLRRFLESEFGVLTTNGIHALHRFYKLATLINPKIELRIEQVELSNNYFKNVSAEDTAKGKLQLGNIPFSFELSFRDGNACDSGWPMDYVVEMEGTEGIITVTGWEKCELKKGNQTNVLYAHEDGPLKDKSPYARIARGLQAEINAFMEFIKLPENTHHTLEEAVAAHKLVEECYGSAVRK